MFKRLISCSVVKFNNAVINKSAPSNGTSLDGHAKDLTYNEEKATTAF